VHLTGERSRIGVEVVHSDHCQMITVAVEAYRRLHRRTENVPALKWLHVDNKLKCIEEGECRMGSIMYHNS